MLEMKNTSQSITEIYLNKLQTVLHIMYVNDHHVSVSPPYIYYFGTFTLGLISLINTSPGLVSSSIYLVCTLVSKRTMTKKKKRFLKKSSFKIIQISTISFTYLSSKETLK